MKTCSNSLEHGNTYKNQEIPFYNHLTGRRSDNTRVGKDGGLKATREHYTGRESKSVLPLGKRTGH